MNQLKKFSGILWAAGGPAVIIFMIFQATSEMSRATEKTFQETLLFWVIVILIFIPIAVGFTLFGYYAMQDEYKTPA